MGRVRPQGDDDFRFDYLTCPVQELATFSYLAGQRVARAGWATSARWLVAFGVLWWGTSLRGAAGVAALTLAGDMVGTMRWIIFDDERNEGP